MEDLELFDRRDRYKLYVGEKFDTDDELFIEIESTTDGNECVSIHLSRHQITHLVNHLVNILAER